VSLSRASRPFGGPNGAPRVPRRRVRYRPSLRARCGLRAAIRVAVAARPMPTARRDPRRSAQSKKIRNGPPLLPASLGCPSIGARRSLRSLRLGGEVSLSPHAVTAVAERSMPIACRDPPRSAQSKKSAIAHRFSSALPAGMGARRSLRSLWLGGEFSRSPHRDAEGWAALGRPRDHQRKNVSGGCRADRNSRRR